MDPLDRQSYSRKEKSLGVLVSNFLKLYNRDDVDSIGLDDAVIKLGVERRRIYDVVNILESIGIIARRGKNQYAWKGFGEVPRVLTELKEEGMREKFGIIPCVTKSEMVLYDKVREEEERLKLTPDDQENSPTSKLDIKKEKSLWLLAQNFVKLFICSGDDLITLDGATKALLNVSQDPMNMRTKVRRLYDIANVFSSMNLIEKTHLPGTKKPAYRWLGAEAISKSISLSAPASLCDRTEPKKRAFGTEITNINTKRNKTDTSKERKQYGNENRCNASEQEQCDLKPDVKSFVVGSAAPPKKNNKGNYRNPRLENLETLSSTYRPQYCNHELTGLLGHYTESWRLWLAEFGRK